MARLRSRLDVGLVFLVVFFLSSCAAYCALLLDLPLLASMGAVVALIAVVGLMGVVRLWRAR
jgi:hypothetical protein